MRLLTRILLIGLTSVALAFAACGDDDDDGAADGSQTPASGSPAASGTGTPAASPDESGDASATATPVETPAGPSPVAPTLDAGVKQIGEGTISFTLLPNGQFPIDWLTLIQPGTETPPCAAFVFAFSWQITKPYPVGDNEVSWKITRQGVTEDVASGADGTATVGCGQLTITNTGPDEATISIHYLQGAIQ